MDNIITETKRSELPDSVFGIPEERKYPLHDEKHVRSAIKLFNHVDQKYEKQLANKIIAKMKEYDITPNIGDNNRLKKYINESVILDGTKSSIDADHKQKGKKSLSDFHKLKVTKKLIDEFKDEYKYLKHIDHRDDAYVFFDGDNKLVGVIAVEHKDSDYEDGDWITALEVSKEYQGYGLGTQLLDFAVKNLHADSLSVNRNNEVAIRMYEKYGFKYNKNDKGQMLYMYLKGPVNESQADLTKFTWYHAEIAKKGFNAKTAGGWDEELYSKNIESCIHNDIEGKAEFKDADKISAHLYTAGEDLSAIYLGRISIWRASDNNKLNWEWEEQIPMKSSDVAYLKDEIQPHLLESAILEETKKSDYSFRKISTKKDVELYWKYSMSLLKVEYKDLMLDGQVKQCIEMIYYKNKPIGFISGKANKNYPNHCYISNLMVFPEYQRKGHGKNALKEYIEQHKDEYDNFFCYVNMYGSNAISFYKHIGADIYMDKPFVDHYYYVVLYDKIYGPNILNESSVEDYLDDDEWDEIEEYTPVSFLSKRTKAAKNQKAHRNYLRNKQKSHSKKYSFFHKHESALYEDMKNNIIDAEPVFIVNSFTNTPAGRIISVYTHSAYSHTAISLDTSLTHIYSFNADNKKNAFGGFSIESIKDYIAYYKDSTIQVNCIFIKKEDMDKIKFILDNMTEHIPDTRYGFKNIFNIVLNRAKEMTNDAKVMVCSQFVAYILHNTADIRLVNKSDNLVTPKDLSTINNPKVYKLYEGKAADYDEKKINRIFRKLKTKAMIIKESLIDY